MAFYIRLENDKDLIWLQNLLDRYVRKLKENPELVSDTAETVLRIYDASLSAQPTETAAPMGVPESVLEEDPKSESRSRKRKKDRYIPNLCSEHKHYAARRVPGTSCNGCWAAYKKLHPENYEKAFRDFQRKQSNTTETDS